MDLEALNKIAVKMVEPGTGILAADESTGTIGKRLASIDTENNETNRRDWREMLFKTQPAMNDHISGVILFDETIRQSAKDGTPFVKLIQEARAVVKRGLRSVIILGFAFPRKKGGLLKCASIRISQFPRKTANLIHHVEVTGGFLIFLST